MPDPVNAWTRPGAASSDGLLSGGSMVIAESPAEPTPAASFSAAMLCIGDLRLNC
jgi:hypothetical protein